ncbi:hypothetical protein M404DRAFT_1004017 [Pisolithus tinctorius Marx 270]|uniref:Uncharacterized protein n=1 Tax=Pisolithus tinctorius Marx 270 TaxID=870435 RepID=A0A0C3JS91_PISTI|nr:hypothetical protein M404DRAFT_1004017 [Pisolithus tinctorius Marx 270]
MSTYNHPIPEVGCDTYSGLAILASVCMRQRYLNAVVTSAQAPIAQCFFPVLAFGGHDVLQMYLYAPNLNWLPKD